MRANPYKVVEDFERAVAEYTGAPYVVSVNSCTNALLLALAWHKKIDPTLTSVTCPKRTYVGVPMSIVHAGLKIKFTDEQWWGFYRLLPTPVFDRARAFSRKMYQPGFGHMVCTSHHWSKILGVQQGGCILHEDPAADEWLRRMRFDGRTIGLHPANDPITEIGWHCYLSPEVAAEGIMRLSLLPDHNAALPPSDYPDLSLKPAFAPHMDLGT